MNEATDHGQDALFYGVDIGGTKIGVSIGNAAGELLARDAFETDHDAEPAAVIDEALRRLQAMAAERGVQPVAVGLACPGPLSVAEERFLDPPNMPRWHGFELLQHVRSRLPLPAAMMNDANACVLAEWMWGAAVGCDTAIFVTMSTGMGAGLIVQGRLLAGPDHLAGEIGHIRLDPDGPVGFGKRGSVEGYLSGPGIVQLARSEALIARHIGEATQLWPEGGDLDAITTRGVCEAAAAGDPAACRAVERSANALGRLCALLTDLLNPDVIVLGTIGSAYPQLFIPRAREVLEVEAIARAAARLRIEPSKLGERRGDLSAIAVATGCSRAQ